jgi:hypothetical protein
MIDCKFRTWRYQSPHFADISTALLETQGCGKCYEVYQRMNHRQDVNFHYDFLDVQKQIRFLHFYTRYCNFVNNRTVSGMKTYIFIPQVESV